MQLEYKIKNIDTGWQPLSAATIEGALEKLNRMGLQMEEAQVRDKITGEVYIPRPTKLPFQWSPS